jgi:hypothetical protein
LWANFSPVSKILRESENKKITHGSNIASP